MITLNNKYLTMLPHFSEVKTQKFTNIVLTLIALSLFGVFAINPTLSTIARLQKEIEDSEVISQKLEEKIAALDSLQQAYSRLENDVPIVFESIPKSPLVPLFIGQIQAVAKSSNIHVSQLRNSQVDLFGENGDSKKYYSYSFSLTGEGLYEDIIKFMENVISIQRIVNIDESSISREKSEGGSLRLNFQGVTYYKK